MVSWIHRCVHELGKFTLFMSCQVGLMSALKLQTLVYSKHSLSLLSHRHTEYDLDHIISSMTKQKHGAVSPSPNMQTTEELCASKFYLPEFKHCTSLTHLLKCCLENALGHLTQNGLQNLQVFEVFQAYKICTQSIRVLQKQNKLLLGLPCQYTDLLKLIRNEGNH